MAVPCHPHRRKRRDDRSSRKKGDDKSGSDNEEADSDKNGDEKERNSDSDRSNNNVDRPTRTIRVIRTKNAISTSYLTVTNFTPLTNAPTPSAQESPSLVPPTLTPSASSTPQQVFPEAVILASCFGTLLFVLAGAFGFLQRRRLVESVRACLIRKNGEVSDHLSTSSFEPVEHRGTSRSFFYEQGQSERSCISLPSFLIPDKRPSSRSHGVLESGDVLPVATSPIPEKW